MKSFTPAQQQIFWDLIEGFKWTLNYNYSRIQLEFSLLPSKKRTQLAQFVQDRMDDLDEKFRADWLGKPGIRVSDDGWNDLRAEVIGRGRKFYESITADKLKKMAEAGDYHENFTYGMQICDNLDQLNRYRELLITIQQMESAQDSYKIQSEYHRLMYTYCLEMELLQQLLTTK